MQVFKDWLEEFKYNFDDTEYLGKITHFKSYTYDKENPSYYSVYSKYKKYYNLQHRLIEKLNNKLSDLKIANKQKNITIYTFKIEDNENIFVLFTINNEYKAQFKKRKTVKVSISRIDNFYFVNHINFFN